MRRRTTPPHQGQGRVPAHVGIPLSGMRRVTAHGVLAALLAMLMLTGVPATAAAGHLACGDTITEDTTLTHDLTGCTGPGLIIGADGIVLDLGGFTVAGVPGVPGEGPGITTNGHSQVEIRNGTVTHFDAGVVIAGIGSEATAVIGGSNEVTGVTAIDNIGDPGADFGDGILIDTSSFNKVEKNLVVHNGPYDGIGVIGPSNFNVVEDNVVRDNNIDFIPTLNQDDGIRLEPQTANNRVVGNIVTGSGLDGIAVFNPTGNNVVEDNVVTDNGNHDKAHRKGDGIHVFSPEQAVIKGNLVCGNAANGIWVGQGPAAGANVISDNEVGAGVPGCAPNATAGLAGTFDLHDDEMNGVPDTPAGVPCLTNLWTGNFTPGDTFNHVCTTNQ